MQTENSPVTASAQKRLFTPQTQTEGEVCFTCCVCFNTAATSKCQLLDSQKHEQILTSCSSKETMTHQMSYSKMNSHKHPKLKLQSSRNIHFQLATKTLNSSMLTFLTQKTCFKHFCCKTKFQAHSKTTFVVATIVVTKPNKSNPRRHGTYRQCQNHQAVRIRVLSQTLSKQSDTRSHKS